MRKIWKWLDKPITWQHYVLICIAAFPVTLFVMMTYFGVRLADVYEYLRDIFDEFFKREDKTAPNECDD